MKNESIRNALKANGIYQWQLAELMGVTEFTLSRKLRHELPKEEQTRIIQMIESAADGAGGTTE